MRAKQVWTHVPLFAKLKLFYERVTASRLILCYFIFSILHAITQVSLQGRAYSINARAAILLSNIVQESNTVTHGFTVLSEEGLWVCESIPSSLSLSSCTVAWSGTPANDTQYTLNGSNVVEALSDTSSSLPTFSSLSTMSLSPSESEIPSFEPIPADHSHTTVTITALPSATTSSYTLPQSTITVIPRDGRRGVDIHQEHPREPFTQTLDISGTTQVKIPGLGLTDDVAVLDNTCLMALNWPISVLDNTKREDIVFIAFNIWLLGMSTVALLNESIPHILASLLTHVLATSWSGLQIKRTADFHASFTRLTTKGACKPLNLLPAYWKPRSDAEIASLVLNCIALVVAGFLSWRLTKAFSWKTFKRIGASLSINRQYSVVLIFSISIQLSLFFIVASVGLWIDQLYNGSIGHMSEHRVIYNIVLISVLVLLLPWLATGWISVRRELRIPMLIFLGLSTLYLVGWGAMFASIEFRWTFTQWYFFALMASASLFLTALALVCGTICRIGFGKGLTRYLNAQEPLIGDNFVSVDSSDVEKVDFPSVNAPVPTYSAAFGSGDEVPPPSQMRFAALGPRFYRNSLEAFEPQEPVAAHTRTPSSASKSSHTGSIDSTTSDSTTSQGSSNRVRKISGEERLVRNHRWIIE